MVVVHKYLHSWRVMVFIENHYFIFIEGGIPTNNVI